MKKTILNTTKQHPIIKKQKRIERMEKTLKTIANYQLIEGDGLLAVRFKHMAQRALEKD